MSASADLELAVRTARAAGEIAMTHFRNAHERWEKGPGQVVTEADIAIDRLARERLVRPGEGWLSEESEDDRERLGRERVWVVDPIDGTRSFAEGTPEFTICIGLLVGDRPQVGVVYNPASGEMFTAERGRGAWLGGAPLHAATVEPARARIAISRGEARKRNFHALFPEADLRPLGSLAYKLVLIASGRFDAYVTFRTSHDWDIAAAAVILEEAGVRMTTAAGEPLLFNRPAPRHRGLIAATAELHATLLRQVPQDPA